MTDANELLPLKPCPFCASDDGDMPPVVTATKEGPLVICTACSAAGPCRTTRADAVKAWNKRAPDARLMEAEDARDAAGFLGTVADCIRCFKDENTALIAARRDETRS